MRQVAHQFLVRLRFFAQALFALLARVQFKRPQLDQHLAVLLARSHADMDGQGRLVHAAQHGLETQHSRTLCPAAPQRASQQGRLSQKRRKFEAVQMAARHAQRVFQSRIGKLHPALAVQHRHQQRQSVKRQKAL